jgi:adenylosuccinate lyase
MKHSSALLRDTYGTPAMRAVWEERNLVRKWSAVEAALASAHAQLGTIPADAAGVIVACCKSGGPAVEEIAAARVELKHLMVSFIDAYARRCGPAGEYFHLGATTQDIIDTGLTLQSRESLKLVLDDLFRLQGCLVDLALRHRHTVMMGRTHAQHAGPTTFGLKVAVWASEVGDHIDRLCQCAQRLLFSSVSGAVGTNASFVRLLGPDGACRFRQLVAERLGLREATLDYHQRTDRFFELLDVLALVGTTLGKIGLEIRDLQRTEVGELAVPWNAGREHGSSTMPHKRNPSDAETLAALAALLRGNSAVLSAHQMQHERDSTWMTLAFSCIPESFLLAAAALRTTIEIIEGLEVDETAMGRNLVLEDGLAMSEALMLELFRKTGRKHTAHRVCYDACNTARREHRSLKEVVLADGRLRGLLDERQLDVALDPTGYIGNSAEQVEALTEELLARRPSVDARRDELGI